MANLSLTVHSTITVMIFVITLVFILKKPWNISESISTVAGGCAMLIYGSVTFNQSWQTIFGSLDVMVFLFALMLFSALLDEAGFFEWCAIHAARAAQGNGRALYRNVFLVGAATTAFLSLDTTAIILTPIVVTFVQKLKLQSRPFLVACAYVANTASLLLPVSNLTNLLFQHSFKLPFFSFAAYMFLPQLVAIGLNYWLFAKMFRSSLPESYEQNLPEPSSVIRNKAFFRAALVALCFVLVGYFVGALCGIPPFAIALCGCAILLVVGFFLKQLELSKLIKEISWELFPFVLGLFVVIKGVENLGLVNLFSSALSKVGHQSFLQIVAIAFATGLGSNVVNNVPMALLSISVLEKAHLHGVSAELAAILGCNLGPNLTVAGSLATMLVITAARKRGENISAWEFFKVGVLVTPLLLVACSGALWLSILLFGGLAK